MLGKANVVSICVGYVQVEALKMRLRAYEEDTNPLPELAPLDIPQYDFSTASPTIPSISQNES